MISCLVYDYIEIACMYRIPITLVLKSEQQIEGVAENTKRNENGLECIEILVDSIKVLVVLEDIAVMQANIDNPHFSKVSFL
jgi:Rho-binding antiterminator